jgi:hypothetical protein
MALGRTMNAYDKMVTLYNFEMKEVIPPTEGWFYKFLKRHNIKTLSSTPLPNKRFLNGTVENISDWFKNVYLKVNPQKIDYRLLFNADETMIGGTGKLKVVVRSSSKTAIKSVSDQNDHITIMVTISAAGFKFIPFIIIKRKTCPNVLKDLIERETMVLGGQSSGWMTQELFTKWTLNFIGQVNEIRKRSKLEKEPALLVIDGHSSRENPEAIKLLNDANIQVITFPSHTTHLLQPLDVGVFSSFKASLRQYNSRYSKLQINSPLDTKFSDTEKNLLKIIMNSLDLLTRATTLKNITNAFSKTGICPVDEKAPLTNKFIIKDASMMLNSKSLQKGPKRINISGQLLTKDMLDSLSKSKKEKVSSSKKNKQK